MRKEIGEALNRWRKAALFTAGIAALAIPVVVRLVDASPIPPTKIAPIAPPQAPQNASRPADIPKWDVVSVKPCESQAGAGAGRGERSSNGPPPPAPFIFSADRMTLNCRSVRILLRSAYRTYLDDSTGMGLSPMDAVLMGAGNRKNPTDGVPDWVDTDLYTIEARAERVTDRALMQGPMLQAILEDRFKMKVHWEAREIAVEALVVAKGGSKLKPFVEGSCVPIGIRPFTMEPPSFQPPPPGQHYCSYGGGIRGPDAVNAVFDFEGITLDQFAKLFLSGGPRFVIDKTGLAGKFDIHLEQAIPEESRQRLAEIGQELRPSTAPPHEEALEKQLGLKLEKTKGPVEFHVVDHIERPSAN
jgi:uncharacterized protein (TIGR03435 family)